MKPRSSSSTLAALVGTPAVETEGHGDAEPNTQSNQLQLDDALKAMIHDLTESISEFQALLDKLMDAKHGTDAHAEAVVELSVAAFALANDGLSINDYVNELTERLPEDPDDDVGPDVDLGAGYQSPIFMSLAEASRATGLAPTTLRNQIHRGRLKGVKLARNWIVTRETVEAYLDSRKFNAKPLKLKRSRRGRGVRRSR